MIKESLVSFFDYGDLFVDSICAIGLVYILVQSSIDHRMKVKKRL